VGQRCDFPADCESGICVLREDGSEKFCSQGCTAGNDSECPTGWSCDEVPGQGNVCRPLRSKDLCEPCLGSVECGGLNDFCLALESDPDTKICTRDCSDGGDAACGEGYFCKEYNSNDTISFQCVPTNGYCDSAETDADEDGVPDGIDNCPTLPNQGQDDLDNDMVGDVCDNCYQVPNPNQADVDNDGEGDACDADTMRVTPHLGTFHGAAGFSTSAGFKVRGTLGNTAPGGVMESTNYKVRSLNVGLR
jgi:hypothetical protein